MTETATRAEAMPSAPEERRPPFSRTVFTVAMLILVGALLLTWPTADALRTSGASSAGPLEVGNSAHVGLLGMVQEEVTVIAVRPVTAGPVSAELRQCVRKDGSDAIGSLNDPVDLTKFCSSLEPVQRGTVLSPQPPEGDSRNYVIATITQTGPGRGAFCGIDIAYRRGWRPGWQWQAGSADHVSNAGDPSASDKLCPPAP